VEVLPADGGVMATSWTVRQWK